MASRDAPCADGEGPTGNEPDQEPRSPCTPPKGTCASPTGACAAPPPSPPCAPGGSRDPQCTAGPSGAPEGAVGGSWRPNTVEEFLGMKGVEQMFAVTPLPWCPHLTEVRPLPSRGLDAGAPCAVCGSTAENWVCLTCYTVCCSRFVEEHMLYHRLETEHNLVLSYSDLSVWCYACDSYVDNRIIFPHKNAAHISKFGEALPGMP